MQTAGAIHDLSPLGKPILPVGQAYDGRAEGGRPGVPPPPELWDFMHAAETLGAPAISFWVWQAANAPAWEAIRVAKEYPPPPPPPPPTPPPPAHPVRDLAGKLGP